MQADKLYYLVQRYVTELNRHGLVFDELTNGQAVTHDTVGTV